jgi:hypothetical protein
MVYVSKMNKFTLQLKNKITVVAAAELRKRILFPHA